MTRPSWRPLSPCTTPPVYHVTLPTRCVTVRYAVAIQPFRSCHASRDRGDTIRSATPFWTSNSNSVIHTAEGVYPRSATIVTYLRHRPQCSVNRTERRTHSARCTEHTALNTLATEQPTGLERVNVLGGHTHEPRGVRPETDVWPVGAVAGARNMQVCRSGGINTGSAYFGVVSKCVRHGSYAGGWMETEAEQTAKTEGWRARNPRHRLALPRDEMQPPSRSSRVTAGW